MISFQKIKETFGTFLDWTDRNCPFIDLGKAKKNGNSVHFSPCPICGHNESFSVSKSKPEIFQCFSCQSTGDIISLIAQVHQLENRSDWEDWAHKNFDSNEWNMELDLGSTNKEKKPLYQWVYEDKAEIATRERIIQWLINQRHFPQRMAEIAAESAIGKCRHNIYDGEESFLFPIIDDGEMTGTAKINLSPTAKIRNICLSGSSKNGITKLQGDNDQWFIVESICNGLAVVGIGYSAIVTHGKPTEEKIRKIIKLIGDRKKIILALDFDAEKTTRELCLSMKISGLFFSLSSEIEKLKRNYDLNDLLRDCGDEENFQIALCDLIRTQDEIPNEEIYESRQAKFEKLVIGGLKKKTNKEGTTTYVDPITIDLVDHFVSAHVDNSMYQDGSWYNYMRKLGIWKVQETEAVKAEMNELLKPLDRMNLFSKYRFRTKADTILDYASRDRGICVHERLDEKKNLFALKNGVYDLDEGKLVDRSPRHRISIFHDYNFIPDAQCPRFMQFLAEIFPSDVYIDQANTIARIQEWFGYILTTETKIEKALMLIGDGSNGKSKLIEVMQALIGHENYSSIYPNDLFSNRFLMEGLRGKLANFATDIEGNTLMSEQFKGLISGEARRVDRKNEKPVDLKPYAKFIFAMNNYPATTDRTHGFFRRYDILEFRVRIPEEKQDKELAEKLRAELPGIFNWAVAGLKRLKANNWKFTESLDFIATKKDFQTKSDHVLQFLSERNEMPDTTEEPFRTEKSATGNEIYEAYKTFCIASSYHAMGKENFFHDLKRKGFQKKRIKRRCDRRGERVFVGISLKSPWVL